MPARNCWGSHKGTDMHSIRSFLFALAAAGLFTMHGQNIGGTITGSALDPSGAVVSGAEISITNTETETRRVALKAWQISGGFGYGRVDMRIDANGQPWILEVNANPDIAPDAGLARMAKVVGIEYPALIRNICELGLARSRETLPADDWILAQKLSGVEITGNELDLFAVGQE